MTKIKELNLDLEISEWKTIVATNTWFEEWDVSSWWWISTMQNITAWQVYSSWTKWWIVVANVFCEQEIDIRVYGWSDISQVLLLWRQSLSWWDTTKNFTLTVPIIPPLFFRVDVSVSGSSNINIKFYPFN